MQADIILVVGQERLYNRLLEDVKKSGNRDATLIRLPKSGGVVTRSREIRQVARANRVRDYFYGLTRDLMPHSETSPISDLTILRIGSGRNSIKEEFAGRISPENNVGGSVMEFVHSLASCAFHIQIPVY